MSAGTNWGLDFNSFCTAVSAAASSLGFSIQGGERQELFGVASLGGVGTGRHDFLHRLTGFVGLSQAISRPRQAIHDRGIVLALADCFLEKAVGPSEIAGLVGNLS